MKKAISLLLALAVCLSLCACGQSEEKAVQDSFNRIREYDEQIVAAVDEMNMVRSFELIEQVRAEINEMDPKYRDIFLSGSIDEEGKDFLTRQNELEELLLTCLVNDTWLAQPGLVVTANANYFTRDVVEEGDGSVAYNWWAKSANDAGQAYDQYKEYVSKYVDVEGDESSFTFKDNSGDTVLVRIKYSANMFILQVLVPQF